MGYEILSDVSLLSMFKFERAIGNGALIGGGLRHDFLTAPGLMGIGYVLVGIIFPNILPLVLSNGQGGRDVESHVIEISLEFMTLQFVAFLILAKIDDNALWVYNPHVGLEMYFMNLRLY